MGAAEPAIYHGSRQTEMHNPFLNDWQTPHGVPPFDDIEEAHYEPAFSLAFDRHLAEIDAIASSPDAPDFDNTIVAMERAGQLLERVSAVFFNLCYSDSTETLRGIEAEITPRYARHFSGILTRQDLFGRVRAVHGMRGALRADQQYLAEQVYRRFVRAGAALTDADRAVVQSIDAELAGLETRFSQNVLNDTNGFELLLASREDLAGLPGSVLHAAAAEAHSKIGRAHV